MNGKLRLVLVAFFFSEMGRSIYFIVISWLLYHLTNDALYTGLLVSLGFLPGVFLNLLIGVIVDKFNRKTLSLLANIISTLAVCLIFISLLASFINPTLIVGVHMLIQVAGSLFRPSIQAFLSEVFRKQELPNVFSKTSAAAEVGALVGSSLGGVLLATVSTEASVFLTLLCFNIAAILIWLIKLDAKVERNTPNQSIVKEFVGGFSYIKTNRFLLGLFAVMFVGQLVFHTSVGFLSVYTKEYYS